MCFVVVLSLIRYPAGDAPNGEGGRDGICYIVLTSVADASVYY